MALKVPLSISHDPDLAFQFITCLRKTVREEGFVGPGRRPLALIKRRTKHQEQEAVKDNQAPSFFGSKYFNEYMAF